MNTFGELILKIKMKIPLEALLFFIDHIWLVALNLTDIGAIDVGINFILDTYAFIVTLGLLILFFLPTVSIVHNIIRYRKDIIRVLCCVPLLIAGIVITMTATLRHTHYILYGSNPNTLFYTLLDPIYRSAEIIIYTVIEILVYMGFPYMDGDLPVLISYLFLLPVGLFIYLLPSINYDLRKITTEMKLISLFTLICIATPIVKQTIKLNRVPIDELIVNSFWIKIIPELELLGFFLLSPLLGILYIKHYRKMTRTPTSDIKN
ncbi:conserved hypothetical protein (plasmid) [Methanohalobium evestigatum Z-7303]|uniref:Uncharacterized protein n=1 Tax=Methanohalobium evestigatum (strain ATCC BAA-1072 / DSM 3721 / NBRC 107634 / OCM 161 / Z-7303) TaxID=644295 RepID=D7EC13_METEZ|nr:hypothetical protein [Methanohalobium evestigatum]ADI75135.1 conserved hypothetical protein [Methanohalobium evestigatum Z-7303]